jgi:hypothetical protein
MIVPQKKKKNINQVDEIKFHFIELSAFILGVSILSLKYLVLFFSQMHSAPFSPDSWAYFNLSKTIFSNFYLFNDIRQFEVISQYGTSFPPLFPFLIAVVNTILNKGIYAGYILNFLLVIPTIFIFRKLSKLLTGSSLPGLFMGFVLCLNEGYIGELISVRSMVLSILLVSILIFVFVRKKLSTTSTITLAVLAGLLTLNRFDFLLPGLLLGVLTLFQTSLSKKKTMALFYIFFFLTVSPWVIYSITHFGKLFVSDNARTVLLASKTSTMSYFSNPEQLQTIFNRPLYWFAYRFGAMGVLSFLTFCKYVYQNEFVQQLLSINLILVVVFGLVQKHTSKIKIPQEKFEIVKNLLKLSPLFLLQLLSISLTGFLDMRYSLFFLFYLLWLLLTFAFSFLNLLFDRKYLFLLTSLWIFLTVISTVVFNFPEEIHFLSKQSIQFNQNNLRPDTVSQQIIDEIKSNSTEAGLLVDESQNNIVAGEFAALSGVKTIETPSNNNAYVLSTLIKNYHVQFVYTDCRYWLQTLDTEFKLASTSAEHLYKIEGTNNSSLQYSTEKDENYKSCGKVKEN